MTKIVMTRPWSGKKDNLPDQTKKEQHQQRKVKKAILRELDDLEWEQQLKDYKEYHEHE